MNVKAEAVYLRHILDAIQKIEAYVSVGKERFMAESHWQDATIRQLEIIGEATKKLTEELRSKHSAVPWRRIAGIRDVLIHDYMGVDLVPNLLRRIKPDCQMFAVHRSFLA